MLHIIHQIQLASPNSGMLTSVRSHTTVSGSIPVYLLTQLCSNWQSCCYSITLNTRFCHSACYVTHPKFVVPWPLFDRWDALSKKQSSYTYSPASFSIHWPSSFFHAQSAPQSFFSDASFSDTWRSLSRKDRSASWYVVRAFETSGRSLFSTTVFEMRPKLVSTSRRDLRMPS